MMYRKWTVLALGAAIAWPATAEKLTYTKDVAPILNAKCVQCHRPDQGAPMALRTFEEVRPWVRSIEKNVSERKMPPWHADPNHGEFVNDRSLSDEELNTIVSWIQQGAARGNPDDMPPAPEFPEVEWTLGTPDHIVEFDEVEIPAGGPDVFHNLVGRLGLKEDKWVRAVEIKPSNTKVAHHVIAFPVKGFDMDPQDGWLGAWAAGLEPMVFPEGTGRLLKKGSNIIGDMHYHPAETVEMDQTRIGLYFADEEDIDKELVNLWIINPEFEIPPGAPNHEVRASYTVPQSGKILGFAPHMHYRGKDFTYTAHYPDGSEEILMKAINYDFNWQTMYVPKEPVPLPEGTRIECVAHYDNSENNPVNPDPTKAITFGDESYDEMMIGFVDFIVDDGIRPMSDDELRDNYFTKLSAQHPDAVYGMTNEERPGVSPLYVPTSGEGAMVLNINGNVTKCRLFDIAWDGDTLDSKVELPGLGSHRVSGTLNRDEGKLMAILHFREREIPITALTPEKAKAAFEEYLATADTASTD